MKAAVKCVIRDNESLSNNYSEIVNSISSSRKGCRIIKIGPRKSAISRGNLEILIRKYLLHLFSANIHNANLSYTIH